MSLDAEQRLWVVVGPTASGKTELALRLAEQIDGEVVSADSVQVYRYFDIGSGKPSQAELARAPHHLIDCCDPHESLDAARWAELAEASLQEIKNRGKRPIVCGGSFLFVRALIYGLAPAPPPILNCASDIGRSRRCTEDRRSTRSWNEWTRREPQS